MSCQNCGGVVIDGDCQYCQARSNPKAMKSLVVDEYLVIAVMVGVISSVAANYIYDGWKNGRRK